MILHNSNRYTVETEFADGKEIVVKVGSGMRREMPYYPERDTSAIAGELDAYGACELIAAIPLDKETIISPDHIFIDGDTFALAPHSLSMDERFIAPEGYDAIWALGATVFYLMLGCHIFQGQGGKVQTPDTPVPFLRADCPKLSRFVAQCLSFNREERPKPEEITAIVYDLKIEAKRICDRKHRIPHLLTSYSLSELWPEEMV